MRYISHELRNPLNAVFMGFDFLQESLEKDNQADISHILCEITSSRRKVIYVLNTLLSIEKIDLGVTQLVRTLIPLGSFLAEATTTYINQVSNNYLYIISLYLN